MPSLNRSFIITAAMVSAFAELTGDSNSLHMNDEVARKSRYRQRVVHGMLAFSFIAELGALHRHETMVLDEIETKFTNPIPIGAQLVLAIESEPEDDATWGFKASWSLRRTNPGAGTGHLGENVIQCRGRYRLVNEGGAPERAPDVLAAAPSTLLDTVIKEEDNDLDALADREVSFPFSLSPGWLDAYRRQIFESGLGPAGATAPLGHDVAIATLLSTLVGMRLPGRRATFASFAMRFSAAVPIAAPLVLNARVTRVQTASETITVGFSFDSAAGAFASGELKALVNPSPRAMPSTRDIAAAGLYPNVAGKIVIVTGASRGIGETAAKLFGLVGAKVVVHYFRGRADALRIADEITEAGGVAKAIGCDIRDEEAVRSLFAAIEEAFGGVDVLINNAIMDFRPKAVQDLDWTDYEAEFDVSVRGLHACCRAAIPVMKARGGGKIINLSSVAVDIPVRGQSKYITAKAAVVGYTRSLAIELLKDNIQVNLIVPAMTETDLIASIPSDFVRRMAAARGMGRNLQPLDVARAMVYLASDWSDPMTGQQIVLNLGEPPFA